MDNYVHKKTFIVEPVFMKKHTSHSRPVMVLSQFMLVEVYISGLEREWLNSGLLAAGVKKVKFNNLQINSLYYKKLQPDGQNEAKQLIYLFFRSSDCITHQMSGNYVNQQAYLLYELKVMNQKLWTKLFYPSDGSVFFL